MALEQTTEEKFEVLPSGVVQLRTATVIIDDGKEIARSYNRELFPPGTDVSGHSEECQAICEAVWTEEKISSYMSSLPPEEPDAADEDANVSTATPQARQKKN